MTKEEFIKESKNGTLSRLITRDVNALCGIGTLEDIKKMTVKERASLLTRRMEAIETVRAEIERIRMEIQAEKEKIDEQAEEE